MKIRKYTRTVTAHRTFGGRIDGVYWERKGGAGKRKRGEGGGTMNLHSLAVCLGSRDNAANSLSLSLSLLPRLSEGLKRPLFLSIFHLALAARVINTRVAFSLFLSTPLPFSRVYSSRSSRLAKLRVRILVCSKLVRFESSTFERAKALFVLDRPTNVFSLSIDGSVM